MNEFSSAELDRLTKEALARLVSVIDELDAVELEEISHDTTQASQVGESEA